MFVSKDMGKVDYLRTVVWCAHARVCGISMCVHVLMPVCRGQRRMLDVPHPFLPFNESLTELGTPFSPPARLSGQQDRDPPVLSLSVPSTAAVVLCGCGCATFCVVAGIQTQPSVLIQQALCPLSCLLSA